LVCFRLQENNLMSSHLTVGRPICGKVKLSL
jgi:hypothetical protein